MTRTQHDGRASEVYGTELPDDVAANRIGFACIDSFSRQLVETGFLHNHARMWLPAYLIHWRRVVWQAGARWFLWINGDCLSPDSPALRLHSGAPALFVRNDALVSAYGLSLKCIVFIYECLLELPVVIRRGDVAEELLAFAREHDADRIVTTASPSPRFQAICGRLDQQLPIEVLPVARFVTAHGALDLKRFGRYWRAVVAATMRRTRAE